MAHLYLSLFGGFQAHLDDVPVAGFKTDKARALLAYLALEMERPHRRQALAGLLWPGYLESSARASLRHALANLRQALSDAENPAPFLLVEGETIRFNPASDHWLDVGRFRSLLRDEPPDVNFLQNLEEAIRHYRGPFLEGFSLKDSPEIDDWITLVREELQSQALTCLSRLAEAYESRGELEIACVYARRQLELEPWREEAHRDLMRLLASRGQRTAALAQYAACRKILAEKLGVSPSVETDQLYEQIRSGENGKGISRSNSERVGRNATPPAEHPSGDKISSPPVSPRPKHNLPLQLTSLIGREAEIPQVIQLLEIHRLVTLTGSGGVGKTRLAIRVGEQILERFSDGVWFIDLAPVTDPLQVPSTVALALRVLVETEGSALDALVQSLRSREMLLVLDNCEHLLEACGELADELLRACPNLKILASSRFPLETGGEALFRLSSLSYPAPSQAVMSEDLLGYSAARLLVERARLILPGYQVTAQNAAALARICWRLDGIPLALELAAARLNVLTAEQIADRLEDAFHFLASGTRAALPHQQTLRTAIEWSYNLLREEERRLLHRLSIFSGGFTLEAAEEICSDRVEKNSLPGKVTLPPQPATSNLKPLFLEPSTILDLLASLVNKSMVNARRVQGQETRYSLLEIVRQFTAEKLSDEEIATLSGRHCEYFCWLAEQAEPRLRSADRITWTEKMLLERYNTQKALEWAFNQGDSQTVIRIVNALAMRVWQPLIYTAETKNWIVEAIRLAQQDGQTPPLALARILNCGVPVWFGSRQPSDVRSKADELIAMCRKIGPQADIDLSLAISQTLFNLGASIQVNKTVARRYIERGLEVARRLGPEAVWYQAWTYLAIADAYAFFLEEYPPACQYALESQRLFQQSGDRWLVGYLFILGRTAQEEGNYEEARRYFQEAYSTFLEVDDAHGLLLSLENLAELELCQGGPAAARHAARFLGATEVVRFSSDYGEQNIKFWNTCFPHTMNNLRRLLDPREMESAWTEGAAMSFEQVYRLVMGMQEGIPPTL